MTKPSDKAPVPSDAPTAGTCPSAPDGKHFIPGWSFYCTWCQQPVARPAVPQSGGVKIDPYGPDGPQCAEPFEGERDWWREMGGIMDSEAEEWAERVAQRVNDMRGVAPQRVLARHILKAIQEMPPTSPRFVPPRTTIELPFSPDDVRQGRAVPQPQGEPDMNDLERAAGFLEKYAAIGAKDDRPEMHELAKRLRASASPRAQEEPTVGRLTDEEADELKFLEKLVTGAGRMDNYAASDNDARRYDELVAKRDGPCTQPPPGWRCTRKKGHTGPCAAVPTSPRAVPPNAPSTAVNAAAIANATSGSTGLLPGSLSPSSLHQHVQALLAPMQCRLGSLLCYQLAADQVP